MPPPPPKTTKTNPLDLVRSVSAQFVPVWEGPCGTGPNGGVTFSLLNRALSCRERFRVYAIEGWRSAPRLDHKPFYGSMWHAAEESFAKDGDPTSAVDAALDYAEGEAEKFPQSREDIRKWWNVVRVTFPEYAKFWARNPEVLDRTPLLQEQVFDVPYRLPSGRVVRLRGKWDGADLITGGPNPGVYLFETKTKGDVDEVRLQRQLTYDLQTMTYAVALVEAQSAKEAYTWWGRDIAMNDFKGVRYNVVRRPLSGGKGTIVRHKPTKSKPEGETEEDYYERLRAYIQEEPSTYFFRWTVDVTSEDVAAFKRTFLDPFLEYLCSWYEVQTHHTKTVGFMMPTIGYSWRTPYGVSNTIADGYEGDVDAYLTSGSTVGLVRRTTLFEELQT